MFSSLKKALVLVPCMIFGLFLFTNISVSAADSVMLDANKVVVGEESRENTYYFTTNNSWEFQASYKYLTSLDAYVAYRVVTPEGKATDWSEKQPYVENKGKFHISDYTVLDYSETEDVSARNSVAPAGTYYVDIKYYSRFCFMGFICSYEDQKKDETIKIIMGDIDSFSFSSSNLLYDANKNQYTVSAAAKNSNGAGYSLITSVQYYFSKVLLDSTVSNFENNMSLEDVVSGRVEDLIPSSEITTIIEGQDSEYKYMYVMVTEGNGNSKILSYDLSNQNNGSSDSVVEDEGRQEMSNNNDGTGIYDFNFGELILLVLVVVLIVSCALIITQKIVDYKKRLY